MEVLSRKSLLAWLILLQLAENETDSQTLTKAIPNELSLFSSTSSLKTQVNNLLISLELKNYVTKFFYGRSPLFSLTAKGESFLKQPLNSWQMTLERQMISLERMLEACLNLQPPSKKINLNHDESLFLAQNVQSKPVLSSLSLIELEERKKQLGPKEHSISLVELQKVFKKTYGWICSSPTFNQYMMTLIEENYLQLDWQTEKNNHKVRVVAIDEKGEEAIPDLSSNAEKKLHTTLTLFQEVQDLFQRIRAKRLSLHSKWN
ncbi:hypothetical protein [Halalkalibacter alkaliphilus]|uniref:Uncharacterized protein n=1 Tax=Halalkalibacter alkaliphilus TaxID=2917993 RepID=A0A9X2A4I4_9BACI|nr:hypothetical protein [Halalkalibacter alkaliphilus]MCL7746723.1 hypothetical protein [Halalkalibacter alkaliphilus]